MVQYVRARFDASFAALSDATRRGVLEQLGRADDRHVGPVVQNYIAAFAETRARNNPF